MYFNVAYHSKVLPEQLLEAIFNLSIWNFTNISVLDQLTLEVWWVLILLGIGSLWWFSSIVLYYFWASNTVISKVNRHKRQWSIYFCFIGSSLINRFLFIDNVDLGTACGKYFRVCCLSIVDPGIWCCLELLILENNFMLLFFLIVWYFYFQVIPTSLRQCLAISRIGI